MNNRREREGGRKINRTTITIAISGFLLCTRSHVAMYNAHMVASIIGKSAVERWISVKVMGERTETAIINLQRGDGNSA